MLLVHRVCVQLLQPLKLVLCRSRMDFAECLHQPPLDVEGQFGDYLLFRRRLTVDQRSVSFIGLRASLGICQILRLRYLNVKKQSGGGEHEVEILKDPHAIATRRHFQISFFLLLSILTTHSQIFFSSNTGCRYKVQTKRSGGVSTGAKTTHISHLHFHLSRSTLRTHTRLASL